MPWLDQSVLVRRMVEGHTQALSSISVSMISDVPSSSTVFLVICKMISRRSETMEKHPNMFDPGCSNVVCGDSQHLERGQGIRKYRYASPLRLGCECLLVNLSSPSVNIEIASPNVPHLDMVSLCPQGYGCSETSNTPTSNQNLQPIGRPHQSGIHLWCAIRRLRPDVRGQTTSIQRACSTTQSTVST